ncbi:MAG: protein arginine kinase [Planctomycetota bacterium]
MTRKKGGTPEFRVGEWLRGTGPESDIAICTRVRLARNLQGYRFSACQSEAEARELVELVERQLKTGFPEPLGIVDLETIDDLERAILVERHLISKEMAASKRARALATDTEESVAIMINEEDHLRSQVFASGLQTEAVWKRAERLDDAIMQRLSLAWSEELGFLTSCPTNTGTGMRLSIMLHLPGLVWSEEIEKATNTAQKIHLAVRGLFGEGSRALGDFYQVSNQITLGRAETQIESEVGLAVKGIVNWERDVREALLRGAARERTLDKVHRALGVVERARILTSEEAMGCLSALRFGVNQGILDDFDVLAINRALLLSQPAHLQRFCGEIMGPAERDLRRAGVVREALGLA